MIGLENLENLQCTIYAYFKFGFGFGREMEDDTKKIPIFGIYLFVDVHILYHQLY